MSNLGSAWDLVIGLSIIAWMLGLAVVSLWDYAFSKEDSEESRPVDEQ